MCVCTCPVSVREVSIGEEVVSLDCPFEVGLMESVHITRGGGVEQLNTRVLDTGERKRVSPWLYQPY